MIDSTDAQVHRAGAHATARARRSSTRSTWRTARSASRRSCRWRDATARALVVGCIDEDKQQGMAVTRAAQARGRRALATSCSPRSTALARGHLIFDPLVFPVRHRRRATTSARRWRRSRACALIKAALPATCKTMLGISNVSLRPARRRAARCSTRVFLYHCTKAGPRLAIVNSEKLERYAVDPRGGAAARRGPALRRAGDDPVAAFAAHFRERKPSAGGRSSTLPLDERLARYIIEGTQGRPDRRPRAEARRRPTPLDIINGPLMTGMDEVGPPLQRQRAHRRRGAPVAPRR